MSQFIDAYREVVASPEFLELERLRADARHNEASALLHATKVERERWQGVIADKDTALADRDAALADKDAALADKDAALADRDVALADKDAEIALLRAQLKNQNKKS